MRHLFSRVLVAAAVLVTALVAGPVQADDPVLPNTDIAGDWHFKFDNDRGAMVLHFPGTPEFGVFEVTGAGFTTLFPAQAFAVQETAGGEGGASPQHLAFTSRGTITGTINLQDVTRTTPLGTLVVTRGTFDTINERVTLRGTISLLAGSPARRVVLQGTRLKSPDTDLTGRALDGRVSGKKVGSQAFDVQVYAGDDAPAVVPTPGESYPFFVLRSGGAVRIDGAEFENVRIDGLFISDAQGRLWGRVVGAPFGAGLLRGTLRVSTDLGSSGLPRLVATIKLDSGRTIRVSGELSQF
jgi:hypothetical protein